MRSIAGVPTAKELIDLGAIPDDKNPDMVGLIVGGRVIRANIRDLRILEPTIGAALIQADIRRRAPKQALKEVVIQSGPRDDVRPIGDVPPMDFIHDEEIVPKTEEDKPKLEFDMGRASSKRIIDDEAQDDDRLYSPSWLNSASGIASDHHVTEEWTNGF